MGVLQIVSMDTRPGYRIRQARLEREWSIRKLSTLSNVARHQIKAIEQGTVKPHDHTLAKLAKPLKLDLRELLGEKSA